MPQKSRLSRRVQTRKERETEEGVEYVVLHILVYSSSYTEHMFSLILGYQNIKYLIPNLPSNKYKVLK